MTENPRMIEFDDPAEAVAFLREQTTSALAQLTPWQRELVLATDRAVWWLRFVPQLDDLMVVGATPALDTLFTAEREYYSSLGPGRDPDPQELAEFTAITTNLAEARRNGLLFGTCFSVIEPEGELGSTHAAMIALPITEEMFLDLGESRWRATPTLVTRCREIVDALMAGRSLKEIGIL